MEREPCRRRLKVESRDNGGTGKNGRDDGEWRVKSGLGRE